MAQPVDDHYAATIKDITFYAWEVTGRTFAELQKVKANGRVLDLDAYEFKLLPSMKGKYKRVRTNLFKKKKKEEKVKAAIRAVYDWKCHSAAPSSGRQLILQARAKQIHSKERS